MKKTYEEKVKNINTWVEIVNYYWHLHKGVLNNEAEFWENTLHSMTNSDWWDWVDIEPALKAQHPDIFQRYSKCSSTTKEIENALMRGKDIIKKHRAGKNFTAFLLLMNIKDVMNAINGTPTKHYEPEKAVVPEPEAKNNFLEMFEI